MPIATSSNLLLGLTTVPAEPVVVALAGLLTDETAPVDTVQLSLLVGEDPPEVCGFASVRVAPLTTTYDAEGASEMVVPEIVTACPGCRIVPEAIVKPEAASAVYVCPAAVKTGVVLVSWASVCVLPSTTTYEAEGASEIVWPETVVTGPPAWTLMSLMTAPFGCVIAIVVPAPGAGVAFAF